MMLKHHRDLQSLTYLALQPLFVAYLWCVEFNIFVYAVVLFLTLGVGVIHHNHAHLAMWRSKRLNRATDLWLTALQGHPTYVFYATHNENHHRYAHGALDEARTYRFAGDTNHLWGYLIHPFFAVWALYPVFLQWLKRSVRRKNRLWEFASAQYALVLSVWVLLAFIDVEKWFWFILVSQLHGLHWLLATNYLQHAHADGHSEIHFARNFEGWVNALLFNIGLHTAHHRHPRAHWSQLSALHETKYRAIVHPSLNAGGLLPYMMQTYILSLFFKRFRSRSLMSHGNSEKHHADTI
jgi:fatty acid desaturase